MDDEVEKQHDAIPPPPKKWKRVKRAERWIPHFGDELEGFFLKKQLRVGRFGDYFQVYVREEDGTTWILTGTSAIEAFDVLAPGVEVRIVCVAIDRFMDESGEVRTKYVFDVFTIDKDAMP